MRRREFLRHTGWLAAGATQTLAAHPAAVGQAGAEHRSKSVLVTSAHSELAGVIAARLQRDRQVRLTTPVQEGASADWIVSSLGHGEETETLVQDVEAIVHVAQPPGEPSDAAMIDHRTRGTYNLLQAAAKQGAASCVYLSSLNMLEGYDARFGVEEDWRPLPTPAAGGLPHYLGEFVCREFAREKKLRVVVLRLGEVMSAAATAAGRKETAWVDPLDVALAVSRALEKLASDASRDGGYWSVFHILSRTASARFPLRKARDVLGYESQSGGEAS